jgi:hypothetical protein
MYMMAKFQMSYFDSDVSGGILERAAKSSTKGVLFLKYAKARKAI